MALDQIADVAQQPAQPAAQAQVLPASLVEFERAIARQRQMYGWLNRRSRPQRSQPMRET